MLITPVQPHNSLNNIIRGKQDRPGIASAKSSEVIQPIKNVASESRRAAAKAKLGAPPSLTRKRLLLELKLQESMRRGVDHKLHTIEEHKEDLVQRKQMLSDILKEYEQISKDKNVLTAEIKNMKKYLSEIRSKLDQSLSVLTKNTTLFAMKKGLTNQIFGAPKIPKAKPVKKRKKTTKSKEPVVKSTLSSLKFK